MEFLHVFYKEILVDEDNIFSANLTEQIKFKKSKIFAVSGLSIDPDIQSNVLLRNIEGKKTLSGILRKYAQEKEKFNLDLKIYKENFFDITVPFQKRTDALFNGFEYYDVTTQKQETIDFYDYHLKITTTIYHLKNFGFTWEHVPLEFKCKITLFADKKALTKNYQWLNLQDIELRQISL